MKYSINGSTVLLNKDIITEESLNTMIKEIDSSYESCSKAIEAYNLVSNVKAMESFGYKATEGLSEKLKSAAKIVYEKIVRFFEVLASWFLQAVNWIIKGITAAANLIFMIFGFKFCPDSITDKLEEIVDNLYYSKRSDMELVRDTASYDLTKSTEVSDESRKFRATNVGTTLIKNKISSNTTEDQISSESLNALANELVKFKKTLISGMGGKDVNDDIKVLAMNVIVSSMIKTDKLSSKSSNVGAIVSSYTHNDCAFVKNFMRDQLIYISGKQEYEQQYAKLHKIGSLEEAIGKIVPENYKIDIPCKSLVDLYNNQNKYSEQIKNEYNKYIKINLADSKEMLGNVNTVLKSIKSQQNVNYIGKSVQNIMIDFTKIQKDFKIAITIDSVWSNMAIASKRFFKNFSTILNDILKRKIN